MRCGVCGGAVHTGDIPAREMKKYTKRGDDILTVPLDVARAAPMPYNPCCTRGCTAAEWKGRMITQGVKVWEGEAWESKRKVRGSVVWLKDFSEARIVPFTAKPSYRYGNAVVTKKDWARVKPETVREVTAEVLGVFVAAEVIRENRP